MKRKVLSILLGGVLIVGLTGCGSEKGDSRFDYIIKELNTAVDEALERGDTVSFGEIQERLDMDIASANLVACGDEEFTKKPNLDRVSYTLSLDEYDGKIVYPTEQFTKDTKVNYCLVYASNARGYLNVKVKLEKAEKGYKAIFSVPVVLNG